MEESAYFDEAFPFDKDGATHAEDGASAPDILLTAGGWESYMFPDQPPKIQQADGETDIEMHDAPSHGDQGWLSAHYLTASDERCISPSALSIGSIDEASSPYSNYEYTPSPQTRETMATHPMATLEHQSTVPTEGSEAFTDREDNPPPSLKPNVCLTDLDDTRRESIRQRSQSVRQHPALSTLRLPSPFSSASNALPFSPSKYPILTLALRSGETPSDVYYLSRTTAVIQPPPTITTASSSTGPSQIDFRRHRGMDTCSAYLINSRPPPGRTRMCRKTGKYWAVSRGAYSKGTDGPSSVADTPRIVAVEPLCGPHAAEVRSKGGMADRCLLSHVHVPGMDLELWSEEDTTFRMGLSPASGENESLKGAKVVTR